MKNNYNTGATKASARTLRPTSFLFPIRCLFFVCLLYLPQHAHASTSTALRNDRVVTVSISMPGVPSLECDGIPILLGGVVYVNGEYTNENFTYKWTGPNGFTASQPGISTLEPGQFVFTATDLTDGATYSDSVYIAPPVYPGGSAGPAKTLTCSNPTVMLEGTSDGQALRYYWEASDGGNIASGATTLNPIVDAPGTYTLRLFPFHTSCVGEYTVVVSRDYASPSLSVSGGELACASDSVRLTSSSSTEGATYTWTGPEGFTSQEQNPVVHTVGLYTVVVTDPLTGCQAAATVEVSSETSEQETERYTLDFNSEKKGLIASIQTEAGPVMLTGRKRNPDGSYAPENHAAIFDSQAPTADDADLYTVDWGNLLIINQDQTDVPDASQWGGELMLDFSAIGPVVMESVKVIDIEDYEYDSWVYLYDGEGQQLNQIYLPPMGSNSKQQIDLGNTPGVVRMVVKLDGKNGSGHLSGSGAIDDLVFYKTKTVAGPCLPVATTDTGIREARAYPTAFSNYTTIEFRAESAVPYTLNLYDTQGMLVKQLHTGTAQAGELVTVDVQATGLKEGMYLARLFSDSGTKTLKLMLKR